MKAKELLRRMECDLECNDIHPENIANLARELTERMGCNFECNDIHPESNGHYYSSHQNFLPPKVGSFMIVCYRSEGINVYLHPKDYYNLGSGKVSALEYLNLAKCKVECYCPPIVKHIEDFNVIEDGEKALVRQCIRMYSGEGT